MALRIYRYVGATVRSKHTIENAFGSCPPGTTFKVVSASRGKNKLFLERVERCSCCHMTFRCRGVPMAAVDVIEWAKPAAT